MALNKLTDTMKDTVRKILSSVLELPEEAITGSSSPETIEQWDSFNHIKIIAALESEFNIELSAEDGIRMQSIELIETTLLKYL